MLTTATRAPSPPEWAGDGAAVRLAVDSKRATLLRHLAAGVAVPGGRLRDGLVLSERVDRPCQPGRLRAGRPFNAQRAPQEGRPFWLR